MWAQKSDTWTVSPEWNNPTRIPKVKQLIEQPSPIQSKYLMKKITICCMACLSLSLNSVNKLTWCVLIHRTSCEMSRAACWVWICMSSGWRWWTGRRQRRGCRLSRGRKFIARHQMNVPPLILEQWLTTCYCLCRSVLWRSGTSLRQQGFFFL